MKWWTTLIKKIFIISPHFAQNVFPADVQPDMTHYLSQSETLQYHHQRTHCRPPFRPQDAPPSEDILATAIHTASIPATTTSTVTLAPQFEESPPPGGEISVEQVHVSATNELSEADRILSSVLGLHRYNDISHCNCVSVCGTE